MKVHLKTKTGDTILEGDYPSVREAVEASRADLSGASLSGADLSGASLSGATIETEVISSPPVTVCGLHWPVLITGKFMRIGCKRFTHVAWHEFSDLQIDRMDPHALVFWRDWGASLLALCDAHAARGAPEEDQS